MTALDEFADTHIAQRLSMINGVAQIQVFGSQKYAVRVYLDPEALSKRGLGLDKVVSAIQNANSNLPSGVLQGQARNFTVKSSGKLERAQNFNELIVAYTNGMPVRLSGHRPRREQRREHEGQGVSQRRARDPARRLPAARREYRRRW